MLKKSLGAEPVVDMQSGETESITGHITAFGSTELKQVGREPERSVPGDCSRPEMLDALVVFRASGGAARCGYSLWRLC
ncbi:hypothetical protein CSA37_05335 [Candidatus Fermentibacteria bacterium]|nr:MAG: hypothetical protein CSA37_05335 [Candidatus Fermentibacteria bacterium]